MKIEFSVPDMTCGHCVSAITAAVHEVAPGAPVSAVTASHRVTIDGVNDAAAIEAAIVAAGYTPRLIT
ncbi:MAG: copper chaperone [Candidimonas sp.]|nr:MAG: copper chaperone [Candidimonas sp.]TAM20267.1 MAG: copper chaperone [Candidimonas sp.]TAM79986.1 MAG: copper chaperone [Candidimonas sp.]